VTSNGYFVLAVINASVVPTASREGDTRRRTRLISVQRHRDTDRSQNGPLDFQKALGGNGSAERLAAYVVPVQRGDLLTLEHRCLR
jgi:hypothetical protein